MVSLATEQTKFGKTALGKFIQLLMRFYTKTEKQDEITLEWWRFTKRRLWFFPWESRGHFHLCFLAFAAWLKVRQNRNDFLKPTFPPKNERKNSILLLWDLFSFVFWRKLKTKKSRFEINWPLVMGPELLSLKTFTEYCDNLYLTFLEKLTRDNFSLSQIGLSKILQLGDKMLE